MRNEECSPTCHLERNEVKSKDLLENSREGNRSLDYARDDKMAVILNGAIAE